MWRSGLEGRVFGPKGGDDNIVLLAPPGMLCAEVRKRDLAVYPVSSLMAPAVVVRRSGDASIDAVAARFGTEGTVRGGRRLLARVNKGTEYAALLERSKDGSRSLLAAKETPFGIVVEAEMPDVGAEPNEELTDEISLLLELVRSVATCAPIKGRGQFRQTLVNPEIGIVFELAPGWTLHKKSPAFDSYGLRIGRNGIINIAFAGLRSGGPERTREFLETIAADARVFEAAIERPCDEVLLVKGIIRNSIRGLDRATEYDLRCLSVEGPHGWRFQLTSVDTVYDDAGRERRDKLMHTLAGRVGFSAPQIPGSQPPEEISYMGLETFNAFFQYRKRE